jgi:hypothetical protein
MRRLSEEVARATEGAACERAASTALTAEIQVLRDRCADAEARAAQAKEDLHALASTRRHRLMTAALRPLDAARTFLSRSR